MIPAYNRVTRIFLLSILLPLTSQNCHHLLPENQGKPFNACSNIPCQNDACNYWCNRTNLDANPISTKLYPETGVLELSFKLRNRQFTKILAELLVDETLKDDSCLKADPVVLKDQFKLHSTRTVLLNWTSESERAYNLTACGDTVSVNFSYIYTACYVIKVWPFDNSNMNVASIDCTKMYHTNYTKKLLVNMEPEIAPSYKLPESISLFMYIAGEPENIIIQLNSEKKRKPEYETCERCLVGHSCCFYDRYSSSNKFVCQNEEESTAWPDSYCTLMSTKSNGKEMVNCVFKSVSPGNYCLSITYDDDRCNPVSIWSPGQMCQWGKAIPANQPINTSVSPLPIPVSFPAELEYLIKFLIVAILLIVLYIFWNRYTRPKPPPYPVDPAGYWEYPITATQPKLKKQNILLLYPRDCPTFMNAMKQFRRILRRVNCKVYDCWDPEQFNDVAENPTRWIQHYADDSSVRVLIVASECSRLLEKSILGRTKVEYTTQETFDSLFLYGIQHLNEVTLGRSYEKMCVIRLRGLQDDSEVRSLVYLNRLAVYSLPTHLEQLVNTLHGIDISRDKLEMDFPETAQFRRAVEDHNSFRKANPDYLNSLLRISYNEEERNLL